MNHTPPITNRPTANSTCSQPHPPAHQRGAHLLQVSRIEVLPRQLPGRRPAEGGLQGKGVDQAELPEADDPTSAGLGLLDLLLECK